MKNVKYVSSGEIMNNLTIKKEHKFPGSIYFNHVGEISEDEAMEFQKMLLIP